MAGGNSPLSTDLSRALQATPRPAFTARDASAVRRKLNGHLKNGPLALPNHSACEDFSVEELHSALRTLHCHADPQLTSLYGAGDGRGGARSSEELEESLSAEAAHLAAHPAPAVIAAARDARCHELALQWTHHLSQPGRDVVAALGFRLPLLPVDGEAEHLPALEAAGGGKHDGIVKTLSGAVTCQIGHAAGPVAPGQWEGFPHWPYEVVYNASGEE